ncbi:CU044_5270 family protein [Streptomyces sp. NPDC047108]|uniref:CU044_5270 family protein n=1 Tax=Streptomyces sp. NPDC047108 TaxID=3155025 RepID=UPI0033E1D04F
MTDELELLRQADPVRADEGPWRDRPLDAAAERGLNRLLHRGRRTRRVRRVLLPVAATALTVVVTLVVTLSGSGSPPAVAAPAALHPRLGSVSVPLDDVARRARASSADSTEGPKRGSHLQMWAMSLEEGPGARPPVTLPQEHFTHWKPDGSGWSLVVATDPRHPGRRVIDDSGGTVRTVEDGKVLERETYPAGTGIGGFRPPHDPDALRDHLKEIYGAHGTTASTLDGLSALLNEWTPGPRENAAIATLLSETKGLRPAGAVTDRLGRQGQAYVHGAKGVRYMVVLAPDTGRVLGIELTTTRDQRAYRLKAGDVMSYEAWMD